MTTAERVLTGLEQLKVSNEIRRDLETFVHQLTELYKKDLVSITVFGSAAAGQYSQQTSDVNLLVVYSELNIVDLKAVAKLACEWAKKRNFSPRFLSKRNLLSSIRYFQIDWVDMKDAHIVLYGEDVLAGIEVHPSDMHWQVAHEIKRMRMRIKQQFWRACGDEALLRRIIIERFSSLLHLMQALLFLHHKAKTTTESNVVEMAVREFGIDPNWARKLQELKNGSINLSRDELMDAFAGLMDIIRLVDAATDRTVV
jgi:predicted nucleotidyltransferase